MLGSLIAPVLMSGDKPKVPEFVPIDPSAEAAKAIKGNIANFEDIASLTKSVNQLNTDQIKSMLSAIAPEWQSIQGMQAQNIKDDLAGKVDQSTMDRIRSFGASKAVGGGFSGSGLENFSIGEDYLKEILGRKDRGFSHAQQWMQAAQSKVPAQFNAASMFVTPGMQTQVAQQNTEFGFRRNWLQNQIDAAPDPLAAAYGQSLLNMESQVMSLASTAAGMYTGGAFGGGGGGTTKGPGGGNDSSWGPG